MSFNVYFVNGYRFHTTMHSGDRSTSNNAVCIVGEGFAYYGVIDEIIEVSYLGLPVQKTVLFKCTWYDPTPNVGIRIYDRYNIVEVNTKRSYKKYEPFILALQATHVYFVPYPSTRRDKIDWAVACTVKPKGVFDIPGNKVDANNDAFQEDEAQLIEVEVSFEDDIPLNNVDDDPSFWLPREESDEDDVIVSESENEAEHNENLDDDINPSDDDSD
ncbi:uncharacterized protein [Euphorbia lathyris]|uniref:uncharacterized protein n=1 Tax=Euphorbia lathyris TaxID=212925 RepID=UPI003313B779